MARRRREVTQNFICRYVTPDSDLRPETSVVMPVHSYNCTYYFYCFPVAADASPAMIFFDEIDALLSARKGDGSEHEASRRFKTEFMIQMDGVISGNSNEDSDVSRRVLILGCSNCPWDIDDAVMRRFQRRIYVPLPDVDARGFLLNKLLSKEADTHSLSKKHIESIVDRMEGFSCSDITAIAQEASFGPLRDFFQWRLQQ